MPKANKHIEVKPSKFKTSLCQYFVSNKECPFGARCVFAHGEAELQTEERNIELLNATGVQRLDEIICRPSADVRLEPSGGLAAPLPLSGCAFSGGRVPRRRPVMVSLPKRNTASEHYQSPYGEGGVLGEPCFSELVPCDVSTVYNNSLRACTRDDGYQCACHFSSTCSHERPLVYRHNPYNLA